MALIRLDKKLNNIGLFLAVVACPAFAIFFANYVIRGGFFVTMDYMLNKLVYAGIAYIPLFFLTAIITLVVRKVSAAYLLIGGISIIGGSAYYFKMYYRGEVLWPTDIVFANAAGTMIDEFNITLTAEMKEALFALAVVTVVSHIFTMPKIKGRYLNNIIATLLVAVLLAVDAKMYLFNIKYYRKMDTFNYLKSPAEIYHRNTFHTAFLYYCNIFITTPPDNYSEQAVKSILAEYRNTDEEKEQTKPDIVIILAESYFHPDEVLGLNFSQEIDSNYRQIAEKGVYGNTLALKYGGGTGEIEFSCLNQTNIGMFVDGISYMNNFGNEYLPSFIHRLKNEGYETHAIHAHTDLLYNRRSAYRNMGIDNMKFSDEYENAGCIGQFIDDESNVKEIISEYKKFLADPQADNIIITNASMQNHMPMTNKVLDENAVCLTDEGYSQSFTEGMSVVATYQKLTDDAIGMLYDYFNTVDREVVVILYGDHQNYRITEYEDFSVDLLEEVDSYSQRDETGKFIRSHTTPFLMWSNKRDLNGSYYPLISVHNMYSIASHEFNLPHGMYESYLYNFAMEYPVVDDWNKIFIDKTGNNIELDESLRNKIYMISYDMLYGERYSISQ